MRMWLKVTDRAGDDETGQRGEILWTGWSYRRVGRGLGSYGGCLGGNGMEDLMSWRCDDVCLYF